MRFRLVEREETSAEGARHDSNEVDKLKGWEQEWRTADTNRKELIAREVLQTLGDNDQERKLLTNVAPAFIKSCYRFGISNKANPFVYYLMYLVKKVKFEPKHDDYISALVDLVESGTVMKESMNKALRNNQHWLLNPSLFYRSVQDFVYTAKILEVVTTRTQLSKFFKDTDVVKEEELYEDNKIGGKIKPAGNESSEDDTTIYGTVEKWSDGGENDAGDIGGSEGQKRSKVKYTKKDLERIKENKKYRYVADIPPEEAVEGNVVYVTFQGEHDTKNLDLDNYVDTWMQYKNGKWKVYEQ